MKTYEIYEKYGNYEKQSLYLQYMKKIDFRKDNCLVILQALIKNVFKEFKISMDIFSEYLI